MSGSCILQKTFNTGIHYTESENEIDAESKDFLSISINVLNPICVSLQKEILNRYLIFSPKFKSSLRLTVS